MNGCEVVCPLEAQQQDERSLGIIADDELICRAAYDPIAFKKNKLTPAIVRASDLLAGTLSVWRCSEMAGTTVASIVEICQSNTPYNNLLAQVMGVTASTIRSIGSPEIQGRLFCVVDETETDDNGGSHPAHAHIKICAQLRRGINDTSDLTFQTVKERLVFLFRQNEAKLYPS